MKNKVSFAEPISKRLKKILKRHMEMNGQNISDVSSLTKIKPELIRGVLSGADKTPLWVIERIIKKLELDIYSPEKWSVDYSDIFSCIDRDVIYLTDKILAAPDSNEYTYWAKSISENIDKLRVDWTNIPVSEYVRNGIVKSICEKTGNIIGFLRPMHIRTAMTNMKVTSILGNEIIITDENRTKLDLDTRFGCTAYYITYNKK